MRSSLLSAEGATDVVPALRASGQVKTRVPGLTDGATNYWSFGPESCPLTHSASI